MLTNHWPLSGLRLSTPRLELRLPDHEEISAEHLAVTREVDTGSWLGRDHQGKGLGTEMRAAVLHLGFTGLGADFATSGAFSDNHASQAVSRKLGYEPDGITRLAVRGEPVTCHRLRLTRTRWQQTPHPATTIEGLEPCLPLLGAPGPTASCGA